jgi:hypothetical protein
MVGGEFESAERACRCDGFHDRSRGRGLLCVVPVVVAIVAECENSGCVDLRSESSLHEHTSSRSAYSVLTMAWCWCDQVALLPRTVM